MSRTHDGKMRSLAATAGIGRRVRKSFCVSPSKQPGGARAAFVDTSRAFVLNRRQLLMRSQSVQTLSCFVDLRLGRGGARTRSAKASRRLRSCKKSVRPGLSTGWPERLRRSLKRSCHAPAIGPPEKGRNSAGPSAQMRACGCGFTGSYRNIQMCPGPALAVTNAGTSSGWTGR